MRSLIRSLGKVREGHSHQWRVQGRAPPPLFLDQTEARRAGKKIFGRPPPPPPPPTFYVKVWIRHWSWCKKMTLFKVSHKFRPISETMFGAISKLRAKTSGNFVAICVSLYWSSFVERAVIFLRFIWLSSREYDILNNRVDKRLHQMRNRHRTNKKNHTK